MTDATQRAPVQSARSLKDLLLTDQARVDDGLVPQRGKAKPRPVTASDLVQFSQRAQGLADAEVMRQAWPNHQ